MLRFLKENGLTIALMLLFAGSLAGHWYAGVRLENADLAQHGERPLSAIGVLKSAKFLSTVFENWESEFLQMTMYVVLTAMLIQKGSAESKEPGDSRQEGRLGRLFHLRPGGGPRPAGLFKQWLYAHSLGLVLLALFVGSFILHWIFSAQASAEEAAMHGAAHQTLTDYLVSSDLWFESFQNWQSEFLSTAVLVLLSIWLRQKGSPESKPVSAPDSQTGT